MAKKQTDSLVASTPKKPRAKKGSTALATPPASTTVPTVAGQLPALTLTGAGATVPEGYVPPVYLAAFIDGLRAIAPLPAKTREERVACAARFTAVMEAAMPGTPAPIGRHTGRFTGMPVFESQNTLFVAAALANVVLACGHLMSAWRVELPNAKCDYLAKDYAWTTLSEYINGRHNGTTVPDGVAIVTSWAKRNRMPVEVAK